MKAPVGSAQPPVVRYVREQSALDEVQNKVKHSGIVTLDTEFERVRTFYAKPCLVQVGVSGTVYLVDPLCTLDFSWLARLLEDQRIVKVMHAFGEDIELFGHWLGVTPENVFDTQVAAAFLGYGLSIGYANLCHELLGVRLDKSETRSDWCARPLSERQLHYAANDVRYLEAMYELLLAQLDRQELAAMVREECHRLIAQILRNDDPSDYYLKFRGAWRFSKGQQARLRALASWREKRARTLDMPRNRLLPDKQMLALVERNPASPAELKALLSGARQAQRHGEEILECLLHPEPVSENFRPIPKPLSTKWQDILKSIKSELVSVAEEHRIPRELLVNGKQLETLLLEQIAQGQCDLGDYYGGWRRPLVEKTLKQYLTIRSG